MRRRRKKSHILQALSLAVQRPVVSVRSCLKRTAKLTPSRTHPDKHAKVSLFSWLKSNLWSSCAPQTVSKEAT